MGFESGKEDRRASGIGNGNVEVFRFVMSICVCLIVIRFESKSTCSGFKRGDVG